MTKEEKRPWNPYPLASLSIIDRFPNLSAPAINVFTYLCTRSFLDEEGGTATTRVGQDKIRHELRRCRDYVSLAIKELIAAGVITIEQRNRKLGLTYITTLSPSILPSRTNKTESVPPDRIEAEESFEQEEDISSAIPHISSDFSPISSAIPHHQFRPAGKDLGVDLVLEPQLQPRVDVSDRLRSKAKQNQKQNLHPPKVKWLPNPDCQTCHGKDTDCLCIQPLPSPESSAKEVAV